MDDFGPIFFGGVLVILVEVAPSYFNVAGTFGVGDWLRESRSFIVVASDVGCTVWRYTLSMLVINSIGSFGSTRTESVLMIVNLQLLSQDSQLLLQSLVLEKQSHLTWFNPHLDNYSFQFFSL